MIIASVDVGLVVVVFIGSVVIDVVSGTGSVVSEAGSIVSVALELSLRRFPPTTVKFIVLLCIVDSALRSALRLVSSPDGARLRRSVTKFKLSVELSKTLARSGERVEGSTTVTTVLPVDLEVCDIFIVDLSIGVGAELTEAEKTRVESKIEENNIP
jgi:hypothetical protein